MEPEEVSASRLQGMGNILVWVGGIGGAVVGLILVASRALLLWARAWDSP